MKSLVTRVLVLSAALTGAAYADSRNLLCDGAISVLINPTEQTLRVADDGDGQELKDAAIDSFAKLRGGPDTYQITGKVMYKGEVRAISVRTIFRPGKLNTANVSLDGNEVSLTCQSITLPDCQSMILPDSN